jgi:aminopeptidase-like protein
MEQAYKRLVEYYPSARLLQYEINEEINYWRLPPRWTCVHAELRSEAGELIASKARSNLEVFSYSPSIDEWMSFDQLKEHLLSDPKRPEAILFHFRNQYRHWDPRWGFSVAHSKVCELQKDIKYRAVIKSVFSQDCLIQSDYIHQGASKDQYLLIGHFDHPSQVNDGLAGCIAAYEVIKRLKGRVTKYSYRAFASVEIVGSAAYLAKELASGWTTKEALFLGFSGIRSPLVYQQSFYRASEIDRIARFLLSFNEFSAESIFSHRELIGNDENIFDSVGYEIPTGTLMRWPFPQYHTDGDNMSITEESAIEEMVDFVLRIIDVLEKDSRLLANYSGMPSLANPDVDLYLSIDNVSGVSCGAEHQALDLSSSLTDCEKRYLQKNPDLLNRLMQNMLRMANGHHTILDIAEKSSVPFDFAFNYALKLQDKGLLKFLEK